MNLIVRLWRNSVTATFLAGLVLLLPVVLTILIIAWIVDFMKAALGPDTLLGSILTQGGTTIIGPGYDTLAFFLGIFIALFGIWALGIVARGAAQKSIERSIDRIFTKVPVIRTIYNPISRVVRLTTDKNAGDLSGMTVVACRFGGDQGTDVLALLANKETYIVGGQRRRMVYIPTAPVPMTGGLLLVADENIEPIPEMKVDDLLRVYFSLGTLASETLPKSFKDDAVAKLPPATKILEPSISPTQDAAE